ncbi:unnamed protein product [Brassica rapa]|uniref:Uncharacterized protein n=2 Tax=Brassica TaxID=3705 RepID=A0A8D9H7Z7_BRACM|nr:unnamed protein product [Brassica napus]CAG7894062.1 unnamed protein product [Brassica rapa]
MTDHNLTICFTHNSVLSNIEDFVGHRKLINRQHPKSIQFSRRWFHLWLRREERKTAFSGNRTLPLFLFSRTHVNSVIVVHEKKYSLEELQIMVDDMDYGLRLTIRTVSRRVL